jgi:hypothetical protein
MTVMPSVILPEAIQNNIFEEVKMPNMIKKSLSLPKNDEKKSHFVEWCLDTSTHGFSNVIKADNWILKIIWIILILAATAGCLYCKFFFNLNINKAIRSFRSNQMIKVISNLFY